MMKFPMVYYTQNCVMGMAVLSVVFFSFRKIRERDTFSHTMYLCILLSLALTLIAEYAFYVLMLGKGGAQAHVLVRVVLPILFMLQPVSAAFCVGYLYAIVHREKRPTRAQIWGILAPVLVNCAFAIASIFGNFLYVIEEGNLFRRGPLYLITPTMCYSYIFYYLYYTYRNRDALLVREYTSILQAMGPMALAGLMQVMYPGIYLTWLAGAFSALILYIRIISGQANTDHLTGLANRRRFDIHMEAAFNADGHQSRWGLMYLDIDNFKTINDRYGHLMGDRALEAVGAILRRSARGNDLVARVGGDEFAVVAEVRERQDLERIAARFRDKLRALNQHRQFPFDLEVSIGSGLCDEHRDLSVSGFVQLVDERMYSQKRATRRRIPSEAPEDATIIK